MNVAQNMGFGLKMAGRPRVEVDAAVMRAAEILQITEHLSKRPKELSGGQKQRVAIGRAITRAPEVFLFDEPLSNLDAALRSQMRVELSRLHAELKATMIYVTHDQTEAMTMADRIVVINRGEIEQAGRPLDLYNRPGNVFVAGFLGSPRMNFFPAKVAARKEGGVEVALGAMPPLTIPLDDGGERLAAGDDVVLGVRPESFLLAAADGLTIDGTVKVVESLGRETLLYVDTGPLRLVPSEARAEGYVTVHQASQVGHPQEARVRLGVDRRDVFLFDRAGRTIRFPARSPTGATG
jgi:multiple sugar transport system ATP-binding protein